jgi:Tol biopolymer transport system component
MKRTSVRRRARAREALRLVVAAISALVLMSLGVSGGEAAPRAGGSLVFVSDREGYESLYLVNADGSGSRKLVDGAREPGWSPRGRALAFLHDVGDDTRLEVLAAGGTGQTRPVGSRTFCCSPFSWSPDESRIVYEAIGDLGIYVTNVDGSGERLLVEDGSEPAWSPDSSRIAFITDDLSVINADGTNERQLRTNVAQSVRPAWSPDGSKIVFGRDTRSGDENLYVVNSDGSGERKLTATPIDDDVPARWSPDGKLVAFVGLTKKFVDETFVVRPDGTKLKLIDKGGAGTSWSPDGTTLAVVRNGDVWAVAADGSGRRRVTQAQRYGYENSSPQWHPGGARSEQLGGVPVSPAIPTDSIAEAGLLRTRAPIHKLAADGDRVALAYDESPNCLELWQPRKGTLMRFSENDFCGDDGGSGLLELTLAGSRLAWLTYDTGIHLHLGLATATIARPRPRPRGALTLSTGGNVSCMFGSSCAFAGAGDLRGGGGGVLVFDTWKVRGKRCEEVGCFRARKINGVLWRMQGDRAKRIRSEAVGLTALATNAQRIAALRSDGKLEILRADGRLLGTVAVLAPARAAAIGNGQLVVLTPTRLLVYELRTRKLEHGWPLTEGAGTRRLAGVGGGFAAYTEARTVKLVRLADGHRRAITVGGTGTVHAALTSGGLFYAYAVPDSEYRGRVAFVRLRNLPNRVTE